KDGPCAQHRWIGTLDGSQKPAHLFPTGAFRHTLVFVDFWTLNALRETGDAPCTCLGIAKEGSQRLCSDRDRPATPPASAFHRKELVHIFDPRARQQAMPFSEPLQELRCLRTMRAHRIGRKTLLLCHIPGEVVELIGDSQRRCARPLAPSLDSQPFLRRIDKE